MSYINSDEKNARKNVYFLGRIRDRILLLIT